MPEIDGIISADLPVRLPPRDWGRSPRVPAAPLGPHSPQRLQGPRGRGDGGRMPTPAAPLNRGQHWGIIVLLGPLLWAARSRWACQQAATPFLLLASLVSPLQLAALTSSHWISLHEPAWVAGVSRGNTGDHESFLLICRHEALLI